MRRNILTLLPLIGCIFSTLLAHADVVNDRNPQVEKTLNYLWAASDALDKAKEQVAAANKLHAIPGFDYSELQQEISTIQKNLEFYLAPRRRELIYQQLVPNGAYFRAPDLKFDK